ncbi:MAG: tetratricopeptide repeat protein [Chloroflexota bacterium]|nr:tetratricopeptide repeat protein [Chloroflexota bacterium]
MKNIKVFLSSPSDLRRERAQVAALIRALNERPTIRDKYKFSPYLYEEHAPAQTGQAPQQVVNEGMLQPHDADLVICMLWTRMGTPLAEVNPDTGMPYQSGTEWEFYDAYRHYLRQRKPIVLLYRCVAVPGSNIDMAQINQVNAFFRSFEGADASLRGLYRTFGTDDELLSALSNDIDGQVAHWERTERRRDLTRALAIAAPLLLLAILFAVLVLPRLTSTSAPIENAPFNVAIAGFSALPGADIAAADVQVLSEALYISFTQRLDEVRADLPLVVGVWSPAQVGAIEGATPDEREVNAQALVERLQSRFNARADIVVYGIIERRGDRIAVTPEFYVTQTWPELNELFGRFGLASAVYARNIDQSRALSGDLSNRSQVLASVTQGLVQMILRQHDEARRAFDAALAINQDVVGRDMLYVLRGNSAIGNYNKIVGEGDAREASRLPNLIRLATEDFQAAVTDNPEYARAYTGLGMAGYLTALEDARRTRSLAVDESTLSAITLTLDKALTAADNPPSADITARVTFGLGQVALLRLLQGDMSAADTASTHFEAVITAYEGGANPRIEELAAESIARLGLVARTIGDHEAARSYFEEALTTTQLDEREALYKRRVLEETIVIERAMGDIDAAASATEALLELAMLPDERAYSLYTYGKMLSEGGRRGEALAQFEAASVIDALEFVALGAAIQVELGNAYYDAGRLIESIAAYERALALDPMGQAHLTRVIEATRAEIAAEATPEATP